MVYSDNISSGCSSSQLDTRCGGPRRDLDHLQLRRLSPLMPNMAESKPESVSVRCEECGFYVGSLTPNARGRLMEAVHANDSDCKHPPAATCPCLLTAFSKARASMRKVR